MPKVQVQLRTALDGIEGEIIVRQRRLVELNAAAPETVEEIVQTARSCKNPSYSERDFDGIAEGITDDFWRSAEADYPGVKRPAARDR